MRDKELYQLLNLYANNNPLAQHIDVDVHSCGTSMTPKEGHKAFYSDSQVLTRMIDGAEHFLFWMARMGYELKKKRSKK